MIEKVLVEVGASNGLHTSIHPWAGDLTDPDSAERERLRFETTQGLGAPTSSCRQIQPEPGSRLQDPGSAILSFFPDFPTQDA